MHVRMMFARTRPNVGTHMDRISAFVKMDGRVTPAIKVKHTIFFSVYVYIIHEQSIKCQTVHVRSQPNLLKKQSFFFKGLISYFKNRNYRC